MSKTPRTNAAENTFPKDLGNIVDGDFARRLESDLTECLATLESVRDYLR